MVDEFSKMYGPFTHAAIVDPDVGNASELVKLLQSTYGPDGREKVLFSESAWRPSLVARSDAEIYDVEYPRWAKRTHIALESETHRSYVGFANLRALKPLMERLRKARAPTAAPGNGQGDIPSASSLICAAVLAPPQRLKKEHFNFPISTDIGVYWNELGGWEGTVFASPLAELGEGVCGQACAYMATYPMIRNGGQVLGIADLTLLAVGKPDSPKRKGIEIRGLQIEELRDLLRSKRLGLHAFWDRVLFRSSTARLPRPGPVNEAVSVITSYLSQGLPVILLVKEAMLVQKNRGAYGRRVRGLFKGLCLKQKKELRRSLHGILLVGFRPPDGTNGREFYELVYHDPLQGPYLSVSADQLALAAGDLAQQDDDPIGFDMVALVPEGVEASLGYQKPYRPRWPMGLSPSSAAWKRRIMACELGVFNGSPGKETDRPLSRQGRFALKCTSEPSRFCLVPKGEFFNRYLSLNFPDVAHRQAAMKDWPKLESNLPETLWIEEFTCKEPPTDERLADRAVSGFWGWPGTEKGPRVRGPFQVPFLQCMEATLSVDFDGCHSDTCLRQDVHVLDVKKPQLLEAGAITSFLVGPMHKALEKLAYHRVRNVDLFAFQLEDIQRYYDVKDATYDREANIKPDDPPLRKVAYHKEPAQIAEALARDIFAVEQRYGHRFNVRGFATYFPEISSLKKKKKRQKKTERQEAVAALTNIIRIAGFLREDYGINPRFIEIVAGARLHGLRKRRPKPKPDEAKPEVPKPRWFATNAGRAEKLAALLRSLSALSEVAAEENVYLAIEIEPGVLPLLRSLEDIEDLADILASPRRIGGVRPPPFPERVGINVDISHMWLCGVKPRHLQDARIRDRIAHVHIGDIGQGHMCDLVTGTVHSREDYFEWFDFLKGVANDLPRAPDRPDFSCCLSVELEACRTPEMVAAAYHRANLLLTDPRRGPGRQGSIGLMA